ncbi:MAG: pilus assembly protein TadG-related protein [Armatimonadota bacterium]
MALLAVAAVALLGFAALTVDIGRHSVAAQRTQVIADAAALAAAKHIPDTDMANQYLQYIVQANNERMSWPTVNVDPDSVTYFSPGEEVPNYGILGSSEHAVMVTAAVSDTFTFGKIFHPGDMHAERTATALTDLSSQALPVLFSGSDVEWEDGFVSDGGGMYIDGGVHSNSGITFHGSHITVTELVEYRYNLTICGSDINLEGGTAVGEILPYPIDYQWSDFEPWDYEVNGDWTISDSSYDFGHVHVTGDLDVTASDFQGYNGIVMVDGDVDFKAHGTELHNVTVIAQGKVTFSGSCSVLESNHEDLSVMSLSSASDAICFNGAGQTTNGTLFAPNGGVIFHGANSHTQNGSIVADHIAMKGGHYTVTGTETPGQPGTNVVRLVQ